MPTNGPRPPAIRNPINGRFVSTGKPRPQGPRTVTFNAVSKY